jgi:hypothetical protein
MKTSGAFLSWLTDHRTDLDQCHQVDLDAWCIDKVDPSQQPEKPFLLRAMTTGQMPRLTIPPKSTSKSAMVPMSQRDWTTAIRHLLTDQTIPLRTRVAGAILLLYAQPVTRIVRLTINDINSHGNVTTLHLGDPPSPVPEPLARILQDYLHDRPSLTTANNPESRWLFPGHRPNQPIHVITLRNLICQAGVPVVRGRVAAIRQLLLTMPAPVVAEALGYHQVSATRIAGSSINGTENAGSPQMLAGLIP